MVSFWPFKGDDNSAASFEKTLSQLSTKINKSSARNEWFRQSQRRLKILWTLYSSFAYILVALILTLVTGWESWGAVEYTAVAGGPVVIYGVRTGLDAYFNYRLSNTQNSLNELYKQRDVTIEKLKAATKYNSTQQLLDKYGGTQKQQPSPQPANKRKSAGPQSNQSTPQGMRTGFAPPPTANIPGRSPQIQPPLSPDSTSVSPPGLVGAPARASPPNVSPQSRVLEPSEDFAPNAFDAPMRPPPPPSTQYAADGPRWYDRILDAVLGEDETQARNRIALICQNCRLVNGQAPPGVRTLEELGRWRCSSCQTWNGVESEEKKILSEISRDKPLSSDEEYEEIGDVSEEGDGEGESEGDDALPTVSGGEDESDTPAGSTRSKARQRKKV